MKTDRQALIETRMDKPIEAIIREVLEKYRGRKSQVVFAALELGVSDTSLYNWCDDLGIDINEYRKPVEQEVVSE